VMSRATIWTLIRFLFIFYFVLFDSLIDLLNLLLVSLKIWFIWESFSTLDSTFTEIRLMIPFVSMFLCFTILISIYLILFVRSLSKNDLRCVFQGLQILFYHLFQFISLLSLLFFKILSLVHNLTSSMLSNQKKIIDVFLIKLRNLVILLFKILVLRFKMIILA